MDLKNCAKCGGRGVIYKSRRITGIACCDCNVHLEFRGDFPIEIDTFINYWNEYQEVAKRWHLRNNGITG